MTREEAREFLLSIANKLGYIGVEDLTDRDGKRMREAIKALEEPQWIPCSERLPEELSEVNVTWINTDPEPYYDFIKGKRFTGSAVYYKGRWYWYSAVCTDYLGEYGTSPNDIMDDAIKVIAWMPLPEPWRGDAE